MVELAHATRIELLARSKPWPVGRLWPWPWGRVWRYRVTRGTKRYEVVILSHGTKNWLLLLLTPPTYREVESFHAVVRDESGKHSMWAALADTHEQALTAAVEHITSAEIDRE